MYAHTSRKPTTRTSKQIKPLVFKRRRKSVRLRVCRVCCFLRVGKGLKKEDYQKKTTVLSKYPVAISCLVVVLLRIVLFLFSFFRRGEENLCKSIHSAGEQKQPGFARDARIGLKNVRKNLTIK